MRVVCKSGLRGEQSKLRTRYENFEEFKAYSETYGLHGRLGYKTPERAWRCNPLVQSSVNPADFRRVKTASKK